THAGGRACLQCVPPAWSSAGGAGTIPDADLFSAPLRAGRRIRKNPLQLVSRAGRHSPTSPPTITGSWRPTCSRGGGAVTTGRRVPYTVYIDPQLGHVGLQEAEARRQGR